MARICISLPRSVLNRLRKMLYGTRPASKDASQPSRGPAGIHKFAVGSGAPMLAVFTATADGLNLPQSIVSFQEVRQVTSTRMDPQCRMLASCAKGQCRPALITVAAGLVIPAARLGVRAP